MKAGDMILQSQLVARWSNEKSLAFIGDGDAISVCVAYLQKREILNYGPAQITVFDFDERICSAVERFADRESIPNLNSTLYKCLDTFPGPSHFERFYTNPPWGASNQDLVVAASLIVTIGDIGRFPDKKKLAAYFGVVPSTYQSGDTSRNGRITKQGRAEARWLIIEAAEILRRSPGPMRALYSRIQRKRNHNVAVVVAVARKLVELVHHLLSNREDYLYKLPRLTMEKRSRWRFLAKKKLGIEIKSAAAKRSGRSALYGTGVDVQGRKLKSDIAKQAAADAERLYTAIVDQRKRHLDDPSSPLIPSTDLVFDPTSPNETDWERILSQHTERLLLRYQKRDAASRSKSVPKPDTA